MMNESKVNRKLLKNLLLCTTILNLGNNHWTQADNSFIIVNIWFLPS